MHCFNVVDNAALMTEWSLEDICGLLDQARDCGHPDESITAYRDEIYEYFYSRAA